MRLRKKKTEQDRAFQYTSLDNLSPEIQAMFTYQEIEKELTALENELRGLIEKRKLLIEQRQGLLMQIQTPRPPIEGLDSPPSPPNPPQRGRKPKGEQ